MQDDRVRLALTRLYAYAVGAQKGVEETTAPSGGALPVVGPLGPVVHRATSHAPAGSWLEVNLNVDTSDPSRQHSVRGAAIALAFAETPTADAAANTLALRLFVHMDQLMNNGRFAEVRALAEHVLHEPKHRRTHIAEVLR
jgi:hypothetical protein